VADTNGCAAGPTIEHALLNGLLELIERDAVAIWWYNRVRRPAAETESLDEPELLELRDAMAAAGRELYLLDITTDLGIPAYAAIAPNRDGSQPVFGCGAHVSPRRAALRAAREAIQIWFHVDKQAHNDVLIDFLSETTLKKAPFLAPAGSVCAASSKAAGLTEMIQLCLDRLNAAGVRPLWMDMTRPEVRVPVVRVIAPGLRHFWARLAPGRLYDVPVRLGWLAEPVPEASLNPVPCMI
jgi:ribosomal protein S12 methylthiotransferase accessory factor